MLRNYLVIAWRHLMARKLYSTIKVLSVVAGFAAALLIGLYIREECSFDHFFPGYRSIALLTTTTQASGGTANAQLVSPTEVAAWLKEDVPGSWRIARAELDRTNVRRGDVLGTDRLLWADPDFTRIFRFPAIAGDPSLALDEPGGIVLTRAMARKYFGRDTPVGEMLQIADGTTLRVVAVIEDLPSDTHFRFSAIASSKDPASPIIQEEAAPPPSSKGIVATHVYTYVSADQPGTLAQIAQALPDFVNRRMSHTLDHGMTLSLNLLPLDDIHLSPITRGAMTPSGTPATLYSLGAVGLLLLLLAGFNFVNLMTASAMRRAVEVGVRKAVGAQQHDLMLQFLGETLLYVAIGIVLSICVVELALPSFNAFLDRSIAFDFWTDPILAAGIPAAGLLMGILAGAYPAFLLARERPVSALKGAFSGARGRPIGREIMVALQFAILVGLLLSTATIYRQTLYAAHDSLRLESDQVLVVSAPCNDGLKQRIGALDGVAAVSCSDSAPFDYRVTTGPATRPDGTVADVSSTSIDFGFLELFGKKPIAGRFFSREHPTDVMPADKSKLTYVALIANQSLIRKFHFASPEAAIGQWIAPVGVPEFIHFEIIGVVDDFPIGSIREPIKATAFFLDPDQMRQICIKLKGNAIPESMANIRKIVAELGTKTPNDMLFVDEFVQRLYQDVTRQVTLFTGFSLLAVLIACLGLLGLAAFAAEQRTKEIGTRKAFGARALDILILLSWQFTRPVIAANIVAWPASFFLMQHWLEGFAYHVDQNLFAFAGALIFSTSIALATVATHTIVIARARPTVALRYE